MSVGGLCDAAVTARRRRGWVKFRECGELLYGRRFPLRLKWAFHRSYVNQAILHVSETWFLKECEMGILRTTEISMVRSMCGLQLKDRKRLTDLMFMLGLSETMDQLAMANSGGGGVDPIPCVSTHRISDPRSGPAQLLPPTRQAAQPPPRGSSTNPRPLV